MRLTNEKAIIKYGQSKGSDREGWLFKRGEVNRSLQKRWCVLKGNLLFYHEKRPSSQDPPLGVIFLEGCIIEVDDSDVPAGYFGFKIAFSGNGRVYVFAASDHDDLERWLRSLTQSSYQCLKLTHLELEKQLLELNASKTSTPTASARNSQNFHVSRWTPLFSGKTFAEIHYMYSLQFQSYFADEKRRKCPSQPTNTNNHHEKKPSKELLDLFTSL